MHLLIVAHSLNRGGAQKCLLEVVSYCRRMGDQCTIIGPSSGPMLNEYSEAGATVKCLPLAGVFRGPGWGWGARMFLRLAVSVLRMMLVIRGVRPDIIYTNSVSILTGAIAARLTHTPHVWHIHENLLTFPDPCIVRSEILGHIVRCLSSRIICVSSLAMRALYPRGCSKAVTIHNGICADWGVNQELTSESCQRFQAHPYVVACVGGVSHRRGLDVLVKAIALVTQLGSDLRVEIWGEGDNGYATKIRNLACSLGVDRRIEFKGYSADVRHIYEACDVVVVPSRSESFSRPALEAMAAGVAVIATRCGGPEEFIDDHVTGRLVSVDDPQELANALQWVFEDPVRAMEMARRAQEKALREFRLEDKLRGIRAVLLEATR